MQTALQPFVIPLWPGGAPGSETWTQVETISTMQSGLKVIRNVAQPTLTAYLPDPAKVNGTAVIVCPGGAFHFLAYEHEGAEVAAWLNRRGIAAFMLKYRLIRTSDDFEAVVWRRLSHREELAEQMQTHAPLILADGQQAVRLVRQRAAEWGLRPDRIGIMGFSAGGSVTSTVALHYDAGSRPDFAAPIYGAHSGEGVAPNDAPPLFLVHADDDPLVPSAASLGAIQHLESGWPAGRVAHLSAGRPRLRDKQARAAGGWLDRAVRGVARSYGLLTGLQDYRYHPVILSGVH